MASNEKATEAATVTLFLCGDVMTGRGIDQILPHPSRPRIHEPYVKSALGYVELAEQVHGPIPRPVPFDYIWGDALDAFRRHAPDLRIVNLETAVTTSEDYWPGKGINYRMHPRNVPCLRAADIDICVLANNHVLDWGYAGLEETLGTLAEAGIRTVGAGLDASQAAAPATLALADGCRVLLFAFAHPSSGVPLEWRAGQRRPGVNLLESLSEAAAEQVAHQVSAIRRPGDLVVISLHWGGNWGYPIPPSQRQFAHWLIDKAAADVVYGHSSHHPKGVEIHRERPIFYGCGDFLNDYEGIGGYEAYRDDLTLMYFPTMAPDSGRLLRLAMTPMQIRRFRLQHPSAPDRRWLQRTLERECGRLGARLTRSETGDFELATAAVPDKGNRR